MMKIIFCNVAWMEYYQGERIENSKSGGDNPDKWEQWNFKNIDGKYYGFAEPMHSDGWRNNINISKIALDEKVTNKDFVDNVLVIWVSTNGRNNKRIVGWYKNARVYRCTRPRDEQLKIVLDEKYARGSKFSEEYNGMGDLRSDYRKHGNGVNIVADAVNGCLLSVEERKNDKWKYSKYFGDQYGHTLWYAKNDEEYLNCLSRLLKAIDDYSNSSDVGEYVEGEYVEGDYVWLAWEKIKKILLVLCVVFITNINIAQAANHRVTNHYINCYRPSGQRHLYIHEEDTGKHKLFLKKIRTIEDRDKLSIYFNGGNILVFEDEQSKQDTIDCWNQCYKRYVRKKKTDLSFFEKLFKELFWGKLENGWK